MQLFSPIPNLQTSYSDIAINGGNIFLFAPSLQGSKNSIVILNPGLCSSLQLILQLFQDNFGLFNTIKRDVESFSSPFDNLGSSLSIENRTMFISVHSKNKTQIFSSPLLTVDGNIGNHTSLIKNRKLNRRSRRYHLLIRNTREYCSKPTDCIQ